MYKRKEQGWFKHWKLSRMIDAETTNTLIDQIFDSIEGLSFGE